jgi:regulation of enolase protein 1 (concanavalin A-like superfamily)
VIGGINTKDIASPVLGFGILKGTVASDGADLVVEYSIDGKRWRALIFDPLPVGEGSALVWMYRTAPLPQAEKLSVRFRQTGGGCVYRIDDVGVSSLSNMPAATPPPVKAALPVASSKPFVEGMGTITGNISVDDHYALKGFENSDFLMFGGNAEVQLNGASTPSNTYTMPFGKASSGANVRIADIPKTDFVISGINTKEMKYPVFGFAILKGTVASDGGDLDVQYSVDGKKWKSLIFDPLPIGEDTALVWMYRTAPLPQAEKITVRFRQTGSGCVYRIDDVGVFEK